MADRNLFNLIFMDVQVRAFSLSPPFMYVQLLSINTKLNLLLIRCLFLMASKAPASFVKWATQLPLWRSRPLPKRVTSRNAWTLVWTSSCRNLFVGLLSSKSSNATVPQSPKRWKKWTRTAELPKTRLFRPCLDTFLLLNSFIDLAQMNDVALTLRQQR